MNILVMPSMMPMRVASPGTDINVDANFSVSSPLSEDDQIELSILDSQGREVVRTENSLESPHTVLPTSSWLGPISLLFTMALPNLDIGLYTIEVSLRNAAGPIQLTPALGVSQDDRFRYAVGRIRVDALAKPAALLPPPSLDLTGYHKTFDETFTRLSISDSGDNDGARWYARNEECCMSTTDGSSTAMVGISSPQNPFSLLPGGSLNIRLQEKGKSWTSGVLTSVDRSGRGFSQQYGYFEMKAKFPSGEDTWPAFWLLNTASKSSNAPAGEIDIVEYIANRDFRNYIATTLHDWSNKTTPAASHHRVDLPTDEFHTYGMMWTPNTMTFYFDGSVTMRCPTPVIMKQPYYMIVDLGIGSGWPTEKTPSTNDMQIQYIHVYAKNKH